MGQALGAVTACGADGWTPWQPLPGWNPTPEVLAETLDGGQAFGWNPTETGTPGESVWSGRWSSHLVQLRRTGSTLAWRTPAGRQAATGPALRAYLALDTDWPGLTDSLPWRSDAHLARCLLAFPGLRLLRQPFGETLLGFLCSATKQIVQIKQMLALLAERHGAPLTLHSTLNPQPSTSLPRLPSWDELARVPVPVLRRCKLGFRAGYIRETARFLAARPGWLGETERLPYAEAKARLLELPGVGTKVADCVLLFGAGRFEAFPVDVWILKAMARRYGLEDWKPAQVEQFGRAHFGPLAGLAQQYLFAWERRHGTR